MKAGNRWVIAIAGVFLQIALGAVYAWSVFRIPLSKQFGWSISEVTFTFTISIFVLGFAAFFGGLWMNRKGPRIVALTAATLYGLGVFLASFREQTLVAIFQLRLYRRPRSWTRLHRSRGTAGEVVP
jgi:OFA family oxalate/formate antiporter-like MFS transporter